MNMGKMNFKNPKHRELVEETLKKLLRTTFYMENYSSKKIKLERFKIHHVVKEGDTIFSSSII